MDLGLKGKLAVVSGSTAGIGLAIATTLAREGARVVINGRTAERVKTAAERIRMELRGAEVTEVASNLGTPEGIAALVEQVPSADILVNNLGIFDPKPFLDIPDSEWLRFYEVNVMSGVRLTRHYLPGMLEKKWGRVIFISSESGQQIPAEMVHYGMTKTAQIAIARGVAESVAGSGVTVNSVLAGPTASEGVGDFVQSMARSRGVSPAQIEKEFFETVRPSSLLKRFETTDEIAAIVAFVASTQSVGINGAAVRAEGGVVRSIL
ncbi:MAG TPA: SDR family NAD(P)-dependent oxidoreductase [Candidatus Acidoferrum sp.]|jgi:NAD(P)-dependent dehydrogenase (short-subunit alcohol dehydrogenase family)|nr:SDR family NAD(P)-dependent oxidoreductase [Candidatus Acidoferrum sp.]